MRPTYAAAISILTAWSIAIGAAAQGNPARQPPKREARVVLPSKAAQQKAAAHRAAMKKQQQQASAAPATVNIGLPRVITRHNLFVSDFMAQWFESKGIGTQMTEFGPHTEPSAPKSGPMSQWGDFERLKAGMNLPPAELEQFKANFIGWNVPEFVLKATEHNTGWRRNPNYGLVKTYGLKDRSPWQILQQTPAQFTGFINVDYEEWSFDWMRAWLPALSPGDQRCYLAMSEAMAALRSAFPKAKIAHYGFPYVYPFNVEGSPGQMREMMSDASNAVLFGDANIEMPYGRKNAVKWKNSLDLMKMIEQRTTSAPEYVDFAGKYLDVLSPTVYPFGSPAAKPTWGAIEHVDAVDSNTKSAVTGMLAKVPPQDAKLEGWRKNVYVGEYKTLNGVTSIWYVDKKRPDLGPHTSNYWQSFRAVELSKALAANVKKKYNRDLAVYPCISWHNPLGFHATPLPPMTVAEFEEGIVLPLKQAGADGIYVWEPLVNDLLYVLEQADKDKGPSGQDVVRSRQVIRLQLDTLGLNKKTDGSPLLPPSNSVVKDPIWKDPAFLNQVRQAVDQARIKYYEVVIKHFPAK